MIAGVLWPCAVQGTNNLSAAGVGCGVLLWCSDGTDAVVLGALCRGPWVLGWGSAEEKTQRYVLISGPARKAHGVPVQIPARGKQDTWGS
jgi:hypothetical protein